jgi:beta-xylosidase
MALLVPLTVLAMPASAAPKGFSVSAYGGDFPDPAVILAGSRYWAYSTGSAGRNLQVMNSADLSSWTAPADPLWRLPGWALKGHTWAPAVVQRGGTFLMYYTVRSEDLGIQCISVATSTAPGGPFVDTSTGPLVCQVANGGSIDPNPYVDPVSGRLYLLWKSDDNAIGLPTHIWGQQLTSNGLAFARRRPSLLLTASPGWQGSVIEGPTIVRNGGNYYLFYGAGAWDSASSGIGYATSSSVLGPFTDQSVLGPWLSTQGTVQGPQGPSVFTDATGASRLAWAAWQGSSRYGNGGTRSLWIGTLSFSAGKPTLS